MLRVDFELGELVLAAKDVALVGISCVIDFTTEAIVQSIRIRILPERPVNALLVQSVCISLRS